MTREVDTHSNVGERQETSSISQLLIKVTLVTVKNDLSAVGSMFNYYYTVHASSVLGRGISTENGVQGVSH